MAKAIAPRFAACFSPRVAQAGVDLAEHGHVGEVVFFRSACGARVKDERREHTPVVVVGTADLPIGYRYCSCRPLAGNDTPCRHMAALLVRAVGPGGGHAGALVPGERLDRSLWLRLGRGLAASHGPEVERRVEARGDALELATSSATGPIAVGRVARDDRCARLLLLAHDGPAAPGGADLREVGSMDRTLRKITRTASEVGMNERGSATVQQRWEASFWYAWARGCFALHGDDLAVGREDGGFVIRAGGSGAPGMWVMVPANVVPDLIAQDQGAFFERNGIRIERQRARSALRLALQDSGELKLEPVIVDGGPPRAVHGRASLEKYGPYLVLPDGRLAMPLASGPLFAVPEAPPQALLRFSETYVASSLGVPDDQETVVAPSDVLGFLARHGPEVAALPPDLAPEVLRAGGVLDLSGQARIHVHRLVGRTIEISVTYGQAPREVSAIELLADRARDKHVFVRGSSLVAVKAEALQWLDDIRPAQVVPAVGESRLSLTRLELMKLRAYLPQHLVVEGEHRDVFDRLDAGAPPCPAPTPAEIGLSLYPYQETGYLWLSFLQQNGIGGLLCDDMGLGKTHQVMALVAAMAARRPSAPLSVLVVCPASVLDHWRRKLADHVPGVPARIYHGAARRWDAAIPVHVTSYGTLRKDATLLSARRFDLLILDEIQSVKNRNTTTWHAVAAIARDVAIGLSGTPVENHVEDLENLLDVVAPGLMPPQAAFQRRFAIPIAAGDARARERLHRLVHPFLLRRTKAQVLVDLPEKIEDKRYCELTEAQRALYQEMLGGKGRELRDSLRRPGAASAIHVFALISRLKQICNHPAMLTGGAVEEHASGKWRLFCELLDEALGSGHKVVVFSQYVRMLAIIEAHIAVRGLGFSSIKGKTRDRGGAIRRFHEDPSCRVFTASLRAAGLGIDLTPASVVIHYDRWWNEARESQATDRVHRPGQTRGVHVLTLVTRDTIEEKIDTIIERKGKLSRELVAEDDPTAVKRFSREELLWLLEE